MEDVLDPSVSILIAQVRQADASHKIDTTHQLLRSRHFNGPSRVVYVGDVSRAVLSQLAHPETPEFTEPPGYNEQHWALKTASGDLKVSILSRSYWGFGLLTSGYLNVIALEGPVSERARLVLDITSSLGQSPWEMVHQRPAQRWLNRHHKGTNLKENERQWKALVETGRIELQEAIEAMKNRCDKVVDERGKTGGQDGWRRVLNGDLDMAQRALAEDNAPGVERALARLEASLIELQNEASDDIVAAPVDVVSDGSDVMEPQLETAPSLAPVVTQDAIDEVPFVDLTADSSFEQE